MGCSRVAEAVDRYLVAAQRGSRWLVTQQQADGSMGPPDLRADVFHKAGYALAAAGRIDAAHRLLDWVKAHATTAGGGLLLNDPGLALYKVSWTCQSAHRLARFDLSWPIMSYLTTLQAPCGGFFQNADENRYVEPVCTAWCGVTALYHGRLSVAERAAMCLASMLAQQREPRRFYYRLTPDGKLLTRGELAACCDGAQLRQAYYCPGIAMLFMARLYLATGQSAYLDTALGLFEATLRLAGDAYEYVTAAKGGVATAILYRLTGDERLLKAALSLGDYLVREQTAEGWWANPYDDGLVVRLDHTAEFIVFLSEIAGNLAGAANGAADEGRGLPG